MTNSSLDLSGKIDAEVVAILHALHGCTVHLKIPFFLVGAFARDILFGLYDLKAYRRTEDVDFAVQVSSWDDFHRVIECLVQKKGFVFTKAKHRFSFNNRLVDIVPFGGLADQHSKISWPPEHEVIMSVAGFEEAYATSTQFRVSENPELAIRVVTLPGLALLKLVAWKDSYPNRSRDAEDLFLIMNNYENCGIEDRLYGPEFDLLKDEGYDNVGAGIRLLGRDMAALSGSSARDIVIGALNKESDRYKLLGDIVSNRVELSRRSEEVLRKLEKLAQGFVEGFHK